MSGNVKSEWVNCPICGDSDMHKETDEDNNVLIYCVNHNCASNGGTNFDALKRKIARARRPNKTKEVNLKISMNDKLVRVEIER